MAGITIKSSVTSPNSRSMSVFLNDVEILNDADLVKLVQDLRDQIRVLTLENEILEKVILRVEPTLMNGVYQALEYLTRMNSSSSLNVGSLTKSQASRLCYPEAFLNPSRMLSSPSRVSTKRVESIARFGGTSTVQRINVLERSELVITELGVLEAGLNKVRFKAGKQRAFLTAKDEEINIRVSDVDKASAMFHDEVLIEGWDKIAQRIPAEIWIRFMTEWIKLCDSQIGKLRLRTSTLNTQYSKLKGQIKVKEDLSESLRPVDFEKLKIENGECLKVIDQKMQQIVGLKKMTGDANLNLSIHKKAMMEQNCYLNKVLMTRKQKELLTVKLDKERDLIQIQADSLAQRLKEIRKVRRAYQVPDVMDYVKVKWEVTDLNHSIKTLETRLRIKNIALTSITRKLNTMVTTPTHNG